MSPKTPTCVECQKTETLLWHKDKEQGQICQECYEQKENAEKLKADAETAKANEDREKEAKATIDTKAAEEHKRLPRKSTRATRFKSKSTTATSSSTNGGAGGQSAPATGGGGSGKAQNKGRNRRNLFKKTPYKMPAIQATTHTVESVFYKGSYMQVGDIVSLVDDENDVYYAQIRGLLVDEYCEKSAFLTWLIPTQESPDPKDGFDAATYLIGPDEELSRKLSCLEFVMHAPSNYYLDRTTPFPLPDTMDFDTKPGGYIWTTLPEFHRKNSAA